MRVQPLFEQHAPALSDFLGRRADSSLFMRSNLAQHGIGPRGSARHANYVGLFDGDAMAGVVAHYWTGVVIPQAPAELLDPLARMVVQLSGRPVTGVVGPSAQVAAIRACLGLSEVYARFDSEELLYSSQLADMPVPELPGDQQLTMRPIADVADEPVLSWYRAYEVEALGGKPGPDLDSAVRARLRRNRQDGSAWVAHYGETPVCVIGFNARLPDVVQCGGAYTPPEQRGHGFARAAMERLLREVREEGAVRATLFIKRENLEAQRAYESLGFEQVGEYSLVLFT